MKSRRNPFHANSKAEVLLTALIAVALALPVFGQTPASLAIPDKVTTPLGGLEFKDGEGNAPVDMEVPKGREKSHRHCWKRQAFPSLWK